MLTLPPSQPFFKAAFILCLLSFSTWIKAESTVTPTRIASLNWGLTESLIELGVPPIAAGDIKGYNEWVKRPAIPSSTEGIGTREEPNLAKLVQLKPDIILIGSSLKDMASRLEAIAPVMLFDTYRADHNNAEQADRDFMTLAKLLGKEDIALQKLKQRSQVLNTLRTQLEHAFVNGLPKVTSMRFANTTSAYVYGENSMPQYALEALGIKPAIVIKNSQWGLEQKRLKFLRTIDQDVLLYFQPFYQEEQLNQSPLWQAMPFVQGGRVASVESTWTYGGAMSLQYLAEAMTAALLKLANKE
ncbi:iron-siderophore ABC transporter substrate-binding protein [Marinomonas sp. A79]|uniref:Iron-siderophore ABC transporter substrate-binding protein n=1 Tax=Marinomonas vulgaris TaxID=2823372 RepID=A0ABS5H9U3_9GAMM|nr:iron-siderophore ABC transporter substrate-binding protein [Marinomonas vulgaris]MBR7888124.1 iron-siderophore ABC transporter substrate-binding protein [Marinomonas vulgaris]